MNFDTIIIGQVCLDTNTDYDGRTEHRYGGAVLYSGHAANSIGKKVAVVTKGNRKITDYEDALGGSGITIFAKPSANSTLMENVYFTPDRERRRSRCLAVIDPYTPEDIPDEETNVYHLAGLCYGDIGPDIILECAKRADVAMDIQCMLRHVEPDQTLKLHDWPEKTEYLKYIRFLKTDAAEAEVLTGLTDREEAARQMYEWGAKEIVITHNTEVIAYDGKQIFRAPLKPRNLTGRTGRGDTTFAAYITERQTSSIQEALTFSAAMVSLKMEKPGPFMGTRQDVLKYIEEFYN
jgi:sugar/nucleoside kinase (ribokinase family)